MTGYNVRLTREQLRMMKELAERERTQHALAASTFVGTDKGKDHAHRAQVARGIVDRIATALKQPLKGSSHVESP
jgi:hypothetical protein